MIGSNPIGTTPLGSSGDTPLFIAATAVLVALGSLQAAAVHPVASASTFAATGSLQADGVQRIGYTGTATFVAVGGLSAAAIHPGPDAAAFAAVGSLQGDAVPRHAGAAVLGAAGTLQASAVHPLAATATFAAVGSLAAGAPPSAASAATLAAVGALQGNAIAQHTGASAFAAVGSLQAVALHPLAAGTVALGAVGSLQADVVALHPGAATLGAVGLLVAGAPPSFAGGVAFAAVGTLTAGARQSFIITAALAAAGSLSSSTRQSNVGSSTLAAAGALQAATVQPYVGSALLAATGTLQAQTRQKQAGSAALAAAGSLFAGAPPSAAGMASLMAAGTLYGRDSRTLLVDMAFAGTGTLTAYANVLVGTILNQPTSSRVRVGDYHVRRSGSDYAAALLSLLPRGQAWPREPGTTLVSTMTGLADYWGSVDGRAGDLLEIESNARRTVELLIDWERNWGLPDICLKRPLSIHERQLALVAKMVLIGGQSRAWFYQVAAEIGYTIHIQERAPYMCGLSRCGDTSDIDEAAGGDGEHYYWELGAPELRFYWTVEVTALRFVPFRTGAGMCGIDHLLNIMGAEDLECIFDRYKPAHTKIIYDYTPVSGLDFTKSYDIPYISLEIP